ncbi:hypothetical protein C2G38_2215983 [Gigaspora rosea]|uniref:Uncharacterized protein n=1 Tax=Gigaspora rosea TaxID=44941 RepID=A0A397UCT2_9GLOM|nr:hypothetical protein C2G38_2215983 [Gigaspora rosea]
MEKVLEIELLEFINEIISNLYSEKNQKVNEIDKLVEKQNSLSNKNKQCLNCFESEIDNKKRNCPKCNTKLPTLASISQASSFQQTTLPENIDKTVVFKLYEPKQSSIKVQRPKISITQRTITDEGIKIPDLYIPDPIPINPNSLINVQKILEHIEIIAGIKSGKRRWLPVAWDSICNIYRYSIASELIWPYVLNHNNPTPNRYLEWAKAQTSETYKLKFEQAIVNFRTGVRTNQSLLRNAARRQFAPIWSARHHPIYKLLEVSYEKTLLNLKPQIRENIKNFSVLSRSELQNQHQGLDAIIEEINKALKSLIPPVPSQHHWEIAARNYVNFLKDNEDSEQRTQPNSYMEQQRFRTYLRKKQFLNPIKMNSAFTNLDGEINLSEEIKSFSVLAQEKRQEAEIMKNESTMRKEELISVINSILISLPETQRSKYTNLKNKTKTILLTILQEIRGLNNAEDAIDEENEDKELIDEEMI